jgi:CRP/FNR family cyclic AMP-dependent transcriptional regulator
MPETGALEASTRSAIDASPLASFPARALARLLSEAVRLDIPAGSVPYRGGDAPRVGLVTAGLVRVYLTSPAGRQMTIRYARPGELLGVAAIVGGPVESSVQAVTDCSVLIFNPTTLEALAKTEPGIAWALAQDVAQRLADLSTSITGLAFATIRERTASHLLELAAQRQHDRTLVAPVTQQEIANAVGSVREVIARALQRLQGEGLIKTTAEGVVILDPAGLYAAASAKPPVT